MADRAKLLIQKRTSLKAQLTQLTNLIEKERYDKVALNLRMTRLRELYHAYEDFNDELILLDPNDNHKDEFANVQERYYSLASKVEQIINPSVSSAVINPTDAANLNINSGNTIVAKRKIRLPEAALPTFDGRYENWLSFKNTFLAMIGTRADLDDVEKLHYLKSALTGDAANKIRFLTIEGSSYSKAWELLTRAYEVKRILISRHLSLLINLPAIEKEFTDGLSKLADNAQQHVASLAALGVDVGSEILVNLLENKLPKNTAEKWEETLDRDDFPKIDDLYEFLYKTTVRISKRVRTEDFRKEDDKNSPVTKKGKIANKVFMINKTISCVACKSGQHPLFKCDKFKRLDIPKRIEVVKGAGLCYNCMRSHIGKACKYTNCTICQRKHNTLLHLDKKPIAEGEIETPESKTNKDK